MRLALLSLVLLCGCAPKRPAHVETSDKFFQHCTPVTYAKQDGFMHFTCSDIKGGQWEVLLRKR